MPIGNRLHKLGNGILLGKKMSLDLTKVKCLIDCLRRNPNWDLWMNKCLEKDCICFILV